MTAPAWPADFYPASCTRSVGPDHLLAMVSVGLWGAFLGRPLVIALPVIFPALMAVGGVLGMAHAPMPPVEIGIALSVLVLGVAIAGAIRAPVWAASLIVAVFAIFHGYAHGRELPSAADPIGYSVGFVLATGLLHVAGIGLGLLNTRPGGMVATRSMGGLIALAGVYFLFRAVRLLRGGALTPALLAAALGFALSYAPPRARLWGAIIFGLAALGISVIELPPSTTDGIFLACWASILLTAATVHWPRGRTFVAIALLSVNAGVWAGAVLAATGKPLDRLVALPVVLLCLPGAWLVSRHWGLGVKVLASWLAAVAILGASLPLLTPTPGYVADHME